ncbi:MAG: hypothetical protein WBZ48_04000 [Bacteroidota bacterium]
MKKRSISIFLSLFLLASISLFAQEKMEKATSHTMKGYLVDRMCATGMAKKAPDEAMAKAAKHTKSCALEESCQESGFGLMSDGMWYKFDDNGDKQALALLQKTEKKNEIMVAVTGTHDGDVFKVTSIKEVKSLGSKKGMKKMEPEQNDMKMDSTKKS